MPDGIETSFYTQQQPNALLGTAQGVVGVRNAQLQNQLLQTTNQQANTNLVQQRIQYLAGGLGILAKDPNLTADKMHSFAQMSLQEHMLDPNTYAAESANIDAAGNDPAKLRALATNYAQRALDAGQQFQTTFGTPGSVGTGANTVFGSQSALHGFTPQSSIQNALSPGEAATPTTVPALDRNGNPTGGNQLTTLGNFNARYGGGNALTGQAPAAAPGVGAQAQSQLPGIPSVTPQQQDMFKASTDQYTAAKQNDANYTANVIPLQKMIELLPQTMTGQGADTVTNLAKVAQTFGINIPGTATQAEAYSELEKYANVLARSSGAAPNSDAQLLAAMSSNPNVTMNNAAAQDVAKTMLSLQRMQHAAITTAQQQGMDQNPQNYSTFASKWGAQQDPRAYGVDLMSPKAKQALLADLQSNPAAKAKFIASLKTAAQAGVLGGANGQ
jgi:hypothetical protein